jgi:hypothetical protein
MYVASQTPRDGHTRQQIPNHANANEAMEYVYPYVSPMHINTCMLLMYFGEKCLASA